MGTAERFIEGLRAGEPRAVQAADRLLRTMSRKHPATHLTERQGEVVELVANGWSDGEIALRFGCTTDTVRSHMQDAKVRLGARSRPHAVVLWLAREAA